MSDTPDITSSTTDWAERRRERAAERKRASRGRYVVWVIAGVGALVLLVVLFEMATSLGRVHPGVSISGVAVGGMSPDKAASVLQTRLPAIAAAEPVTVVYGDKTWEISASDVGITFDTTHSVEAAMAVGRTGGLFPALGARGRAWFGGVDAPAVVDADDTKMAATLDKIAEGTDVAPVDADVEIDGTDATVVPSKDGKALQRPAAESDILAAFLADVRKVEAPVAVANVAVTDEEAQAALETARVMYSAPITVTFDKKKWTFDEKDVASWIDFRRSDKLDDSAAEAAEAAEASGSVRPSSAETDAPQVTLVALVDAELAAKTILPAVGTGVGRAPKDARFKTAGGKVNIIPSETGIGPDIGSLALLLTQELPQEGVTRVFELRTNRTEPELTTAEAEQMGVKERISTYTTTFSSGNAPRVNNIHLLGNKLDGTIVPPGKTFSFNGAVGERTAAAGYKEANAIVNGKLVPQLGGGICQVGTTLFNTVFESGLPVVERRNHSFYISHYPKGRDATVSWGGPDFKFRNDTDTYILISVGYTNSSITISLYGTDPGYEVESRTGSWRNERPFPTEEVKDPTLPVGSKVIEDGGVTGRSISVERIVSKNGKVIRTDTFVSNYRPKVQVVRVGTKPKAAKPTTTTPAP